MAVQFENFGTGPSKMDAVHAPEFQETTSRVKEEQEMRNSEETKEDFVDLTMDEENNDGDICMDSAAESSEMEEDEVREVLFPDAEVVVLAGYLDHATFTHIRKQHNFHRLHDEAIEAMVETMQRHPRGRFIIHCGGNLDETLHKLDTLAGFVSTFLIGNTYSADQSEQDDGNELCLIRLSGPPSSPNALQTINFAINNRHLNLLEVR